MVPKTKLNQVLLYLDGIPIIVKLPPSCCLQCRLLQLNFYQNI